MLVRGAAMDPAALIVGVLVCSKAFVNGKCAITRGEASLEKGHDGMFLHLLLYKQKLRS